NPLAACMRDAQSRLVEQQRLRGFVAIHQRGELQPEELNRLGSCFRSRELEPRRRRNSVVIMACAAFGFLEYRVDLVGKEALVNALLGKLGSSEDEKRQYAELLCVMQCRHSGYYLTHPARTPAPPAFPLVPWRSGCDPSPAPCNACRHPPRSRPASVCIRASSAGIRPASRIRRCSGSRCHAPARGPGCWFRRPARRPAIPATDGAR